MTASANTLLEYAKSIRPELVVGILLFYVLRKSLKSKSSRPQIPGPYPWPIIGNVASLGDQPQKSMQAMAKKYGPVFLMRLGTVDVLVLNDAKSIKEALGKQKEVFEGRPQFKSFSNISQGKGIVFNSPLTQGKNWRKMKMAVIKHLHRFVTSPDTQSQLSDHVRKESVEMVCRIREQCQKSPDGFVDPESTINVSIANITCAFLFGHRYDYENKEFQGLVSLNRQFGEVVGAGSQVDVMPWITIFPSFKKAIKTFDFLNERLNNWMKKRTTEHRATYRHGVTRDVVDSFITEGEENSQSLLKNDIVMALTTDVFGAAVDTLSTTIQWIIIYMMYFPKVQEKIQKEIDSVQEHDDLPNISDNKLYPYTTAVMHEIFRHSTFTSTTIPHSTISETTLNGFKIPKGLLVFVNQYAANHDPNVWENPDEFIPERFLTSSGELINKPQDQYFLFSYGSRKCPGDEISRLMLVHLMVNLLTLGQFESDPAKPATLDGVYNLSMRPKELRTKFKVRKPELLESLTQKLDQFSPNIQTVNSQSSSFVSGDSQDNTDQTDEESSNSFANFGANFQKPESTFRKEFPFQARIDSLPISQPSRK